MKIVKKDFVPEDTDSYCAKGHKLSSGKAYFMETGNGHIVYGGKQCAEKHSNTDLSQIPDLTKSLVSRTEGATRNDGITANRKNAHNNLDKPKAIAYIILREEKLISFQYRNKSLSQVTLQKYYEKYKQGEDLSDDEVKHILNLEKIAAKKTKAKMSLKNLSTCYAYQYLLERTLVYLDIKNNTAGITFVNSLINSLHDYCSLTNKQIEGLARWLQFLPKDLAESKLKQFNV